MPWQPPICWWRKAGTRSARRARRSRLRRRCWWRSTKFANGCRPWRRARTLPRPRRGRIFGRRPARARSACVFHPEDLGRHVDLADVNQPARAELEFQEALAIGAQRDLVVDARGHVAEMRGRHVLAADRLEIEDV